MCIRDDDDDNSKTLLAPLYHKGVTVQCNSFTDALRV